MNIMKIRKPIATTIKEFLNENAFNDKLIGYHISQYNFNSFNSSENIGNFGTVLDASYFLSDKNESLRNFGNNGILYTVEIIPKKIFRFDLRTDEHWYLATEFQELFIERLAGISNYLDEFFDEEKIDITDIDCVILTSLDYLNDKNIEEYIVLDNDIIKIINKETID